MEKGIDGKYIMLGLTIVAMAFSLKGQFSSRRLFCVF